MDTQELVLYVNKHLALGQSTASIEKSMQVGKDTIRKKLNRAGYGYNKALNQYVLKDINLDCTKIPQNNSLGYNTTQDNTVSYKIKKDEYNPVINKKTGVETKMNLKQFKTLSTKEQVDLINKYANGVLTLKQIEEQYFTFTNISKYINREEAYWNGEKKQYIFIEQNQEVFTTDEIAFIKRLYKQHSITQSINNIKSGEIITRSIRVDKNAMDLFADYCKENNLKQVNALTKALLNFIENK